MAGQTDSGPTGAARDWVRVLAKYRDPCNFRSGFELAVSLLPFVVLWILACWVARYTYTGAILISAVNGMFLVRLFGIQHDCGHGSFFGNRQVSDWVGRALGVLTLTPYDVWRRTHSVHHNHAGNLSKRGMGDVLTLTIGEYRRRGPVGRLLYRAYRHPLILFGLGPTYLFILQNRLPVGLMTQGRSYWISAMGTNLAIALAMWGIVWLGGWQALVLVFLPSTLVAASVGVWLFYIQHQFEETHWDEERDWQLHEAALHGSSHYVLPPILRWFTANIGIHHVHHLYSRIPFYRLPDVLSDHAELVEYGRITLWESFRCARFHLWDEEARRLVSFAEARTRPAPA